MQLQLRESPAPRRGHPFILVPLPALAFGLLLSACTRVQDVPAPGRAAALAMHHADDGVQAIAVQEVQEPPAWLRGASPDPAPNKAKDAALGATVTAALSRDPTLNTSRIVVDNAGGHVILLGTAANDTARARAGMLAAQVQGVLSVQNQLRTAPAL